MTAIRLISISVLLFVATSAQAEGSVSTDIELQTLWADVAGEPDNVDARLKFALYLSRTDDYLDEAEKQAEMVIAKTPAYWDAYLLLARIAGRKKQFDKALRLVQIPIRNDPKNLEARLLKVDLFLWNEKQTEAEKELHSLILEFPDVAVLYSKLAEIDFAKKKYLSAYRNAKKAQTIDPANERSKALVRDIEYVTVYATHEFEYYGFPLEEAQKDRFGYGLNLVGRVFRTSDFSAALIETSRFRFQTVNNQVGLEVNIRPMRLLDLTLRGLLGAPARVIPKGSLFFSARAEFWKRMDIAPSYALDILAWPDEKPALLHRPSLTAGLNIDSHFNVSAGYTMGLLQFCGRTPTVIHSGNAMLSVRDERVSVQSFYSFGQEIDPYILGAASIPSCRMIDAAENTTQAGRAGFRLVELRTHSGGMLFSWMLTQQFSISGGYRFEFRMLSNAEQIIPAHITQLGLVTHF